MLLKYQVQVPFPSFWEELIIFIITITAIHFASSLIDQDPLLISILALFSFIIFPKLLFLITAIIQ